MKPSRNFGLDVIRMCAILPVLAEHFFAIALKNPPAWLWPAGSFGVGIFFVLSGFLIGGIILRDFAPGMSRGDVRFFYIRRWMRTLPLYFVFFVATMFFTIAGVKLDAEFNLKCLSYLVFLQNLAWPLPANWYQETWSLAVEEWFYLLFPILFLALPFRGTRARVFGVAAILTVVPLIVRSVVFWKTGNTVTALQAIVILKLDSIAIGIFSVLAYEQFSKTVSRNAGLLCATGTLGAALCYVVPLQLLGNHPRFMVSFWPIVMAICIAAVMLGARSFEWRRLSNSVVGSIVRWISTRSYALYLCNGSIIKLMLAKGFMWRGLDVSLPMFIAISIVVAELAHRLIEKPFMKMRPHEKTQSRQANGSLTDKSVGAL
ncbi:hypothetical protein KBK24_0121810 [Burkholderia sp. K24]|nr:hypothetical protein KBK24_0121810 [Burkholderia sp. K24]